LVPTFPLTPDGDRLSKQSLVNKHIGRECENTHSAGVGIAVVSEIEVHPGIEDKEAVTDSHWYLFRGTAEQLQAYR
jgi:hypothetical protein